MAEKQKNIKKQTKTNKVKFGLRKLDFKKNWKKLSYLGLSGFLALTSVGYGTWKSFDHSANAAGWITVKKSYYNQVFDNSYRSNQWGLFNYTIPKGTKIKFCINAMPERGQLYTTFILKPTYLQPYRFTTSSGGIRTYCASGVTASSGNVQFAVQLLVDVINKNHNGPALVVQDAYLQYYSLYY